MEGSVAAGLVDADSEAGLVDFSAKGSTAAVAGSVAVGLAVGLAEGVAVGREASSAAGSVAAGSATAGSVTGSAIGAGSAARPGWGSLRPPSAKDIAPRRMRKGLDAPVPPFEHLVVLDFEWTADKQRRMEPCSEITQFPSVLVKLAGRATKVIDEFDTFVRPRFNPLLSRFARELTAITQADVDGAPSLEEVIPRYLAWLHSHGLAALDGAKIGHWAFCTWSDADVGTQLATETRTKGIPLPQCFQNWVDLKPCYRSHFRTEPRGGLQACVERLGLAWEGRAHNGLVDSQNTSKIVLHMAQGSYMHGAFVFKRPTRGLDAATGIPFGSAKRKRT